MKISIIGGGRVGQTIGRLAREAGYEIGDVVCRERRTARKAVRFIGAGNPCAARGARLSTADLLLISTPDDRIEEATALIESNVEALKGAVALHTSGAVSSEALSSLIAYGISTGSCHPLQTFESPARSLALVRQSYFCIEGSPRAARAARLLVRRLGARHFEIKTEMKELYHAAAVMASGGVVSLLSICLEALTLCGLDEHRSRKVLMPLVEATVANVRAIGPARALTGPVRRGDAKTIERNKRALAKIESRWLQIYMLLTENSLASQKQSGASGASRS